MNNKAIICEDGYVRISDDRTNTQTEHVRVAEKKLGRKIGKKEIVHHVDGDRSNNDPSNLLVFRTAGDHNVHHSKIPCELIETQDGSYLAVKIQRFCSFCNRPFEPVKFDQKYCDLACYGRQKAKNIPTSEELKNLVNQLPATAVGPMFGVSDVTIKKWCERFGIINPRSHKTKTE